MIIRQITPFIAFSLIALMASVVSAEQVSRVEDAAEKAQAAAYMASFVGKSMGGDPVLDITSVPTHAIVAFEQDLINFKTQEETDAKGAIQDRITGAGEQATGISKAVNSKLSQLKMGYQGLSENTGEGLLGTEDVVTEAGEKTTYDLATEQIQNYTLNTGTVEGKEVYRKERLYAEQQQAIRLLALAVILRTNVAKQVPKLIETVKSNYRSSPVGKDLGNSGGSVDSNNNYNMALRQYAYNSLAYDQLLSLEQQVMGLRLQAKGTMYEQALQPLTDKLETKQEGSDNQ